ncbi:MAG TPA: serine--tRNA ligase [Candidatus Faecalibacterium avium]|nr:serine--tRNA ligase [Candidatus Faecalibacterium avium]
MLDIKFVRENPDAVKENIHKKFQDAKIPLVDEVIDLDAQYRRCLQEAENLKAQRNKLSKANGPLFGQLKKCTDEAKKAELQAQIDANNAAVKADAEQLAALEADKDKMAARIQEIMYTIPQMIDPSVPIGPDDSCNVEAQRFGEPVVPDFPIPYHTEIMESFDGIDMDAAGRVAGNGFYYLMGNIARLHEAVLAYARDFMISKGFTYVIPPFMMHGNVVQGVMSFPEMDAMMYKIEGEDLYLIGTSEHTMIGRFIDQTIDEAKLPLTLTSYSPCFRKEKGAHGIEERGIYRIHQFEKQEMIVVCRPEESNDWYEKLWHYSVELFRNFEIPVRQLVCCSGDLADLKVKSCDIEAWSPRQQKYFEVCSCSNLGDAQARRLHIRVKGADGKNYLAHTLNNTCVAPPRMLIAFLENHLQADGSVTIPKCLQPYMGGLEVMVPTHKK